MTKTTTSLTSLERWAGSLSFPGGRFVMVWAKLIALQIGCRTRRGFACLVSSRRPHDDRISMQFGSRLLRKGRQALGNLKPGQRTHVDPVSPLDNSPPAEPTEVAVRTGTRVYLRKHRLTDRETFVQWYQDPEIAELLRHDLCPLTRIQAQGYFDSIVMPSSSRGLCWAICELDTHQLIGSTAIVDKNEVTKAALFRIVIGDKSRWNMGFGTEATGLVLAEAFTTHGLQRVNLEVFSHNPRAQRAYLRAGFEIHGRHAEWVSRAHRQIDVMEMSISRDSWLAHLDRPA